jgi:hypothetical protein
MTCCNNCLAFAALCSGSISCAAAGLPQVHAIHSNKKVQAIARNISRTRIKPPLTWKTLPAVKVAKIL